jgi:hypothetical protein
METVQLPHPLQTVQQTLAVEVEAETLVVAMVALA